MRTHTRDHRDPGRRAGRARAGASDHPLLALQAQAGNLAVNRMLQGDAAETGIADRIRAASGGGSPLPAQPRRSLERELGASLGDVRVHHDAGADALTRSVQAQAFTSGPDIFFSAGAYNPSTPGGLHLLAHEAVHTVQQRRGPVAGTPAAGGISLSDPSDPFERAAESVAARVARSAGGGGGRVPVPLQPTTGTGPVERGRHRDRHPEVSGRPAPSIQRKNLPSWSAGRPVREEEEVKHSDGCPCVRVRLI